MMSHLIFVHPNLYQISIGYRFVYQARKTSHGVDPLLPPTEFAFCHTQGTFLVTQAVTKALLEEEKEEGAQEGRGSIVNIAGISGKMGFSGASHCAASKGGVIALSKSCAAEMAG